MSVDALSVKLAEIMEQETEIINNISRAEENLQQALRTGSWEKMEIIISNLGPLSLQMDKIESDRDRVYQKLKARLKKRDEDGFYSVALHMNGKSREDCLGGYRKMKIALLRMQGITAGIDQYVRTVGTTSKAVLDEVFPHRKGRIYLKNGNEKMSQSDPMILNRHL
jgi:hypothetical protein